jgi:hypothetical protein
MDKFGIEPLPSPFKVYSNIQTVTVGSFLDSTDPAWGVTFIERIDIDFIPDIIILKQLNSIYYPISNPARTEQIFTISSNLVPNYNAISFPIGFIKLYDSTGDAIIRATTSYTLKPDIHWLNKSNNRIQGNYYFQLSSLTNNTFDFQGYVSLTFEFIKY